MMYNTTGFGAAMDGSTSQHPDVAQSVSEVGNEYSELVQITQSDGIESHFADAPVELLGALVRISESRIFALAQLAQITSIFHQPRFDVLVVQEPIWAGKIQTVQNLKNKKV
jgi:hypothetical protein